MSGRFKVEQDQKYDDMHRALVGALNQIASSLDPRAARLAEQAKNATEAMAYAAEIVTQYPLSHPADGREKVTDAVRSLLAATPLLPPPEAWLLDALRSRYDAYQACMTV